MHMKLKERINKNITEYARYGKVLSVRLNEEMIARYIQEEGIKLTDSQRTKLIKLVERTKNNVSLRKMLRAIGRRGERHQIKNRLIRKGYQVTGLEYGTIVTML